MAYYESGVGGRPKISFPGEDSGEEEISIMERIGNEMA